LALAMTVSPLHGQDAILANSCAKCRIRIVKVTELRDEVTGQPEFITKLRDGSYVTVLYRSRSDVRLYGRNGRFKRLIGRRGAGPGEYKDVTDAAVGSGDTLYVFDPGNNRISVLDSALRHVRTMPLRGWVREALLLPGKRIAFTADVLNSEGVGAPLHVLNTNDGTVRSFGADGASQSGENARLLMYRLIANRNGAILSARMQEYTLELWSPEGALLKRARRPVGWFKPWHRYESISPRRPPKPAVQEIAVDHGGLVWTAVSIAGKDHSKGLSQNPVTREGQRFYDILRADLVFDAVIEAIDFDRNTVLASARISGLFVGWVAGSNDFATYREPDGNPVITIWRVVLDRPKVP
jgi:hypothetical protein